MSEEYNSKKYVSRNVQPSKHNPWLHALQSTIRTKDKSVGFASKTNAVVDMTTGETSDLHAVVGIRKPVDTAEFVKIFEAGISSVFDLDKGARDLFRAILTLYLNQKHSGEKIYINHSVVSEVGYDKKQQTYNRALNVLINKDFIREVEGQLNQFWINPNYFYKGNRLTLVQDYAIKGTAEGDKMEKDIAQTEQKTLL